MRIGRARAGRSLSICDEEGVRWYVLYMLGVDQIAIKSWRGTVGGANGEGSGTSMTRRIKKSAGSDRASSTRIR